MKLELKHLAPYLPYGLKIYACQNEYVLELEEEMDNETISVRETIENNHKPILFPISDLTKEICINGLFFCPIKCLLEDVGFDVSEFNNSNFNIKTDTFTDLDISSFNDVQKLLEWHFDVFGLIEKGLAIDINTLNQ